MRWNYLWIAVLPLLALGCATTKKTAAPAAAKTDVYVHTAAAGGGATTSAGICRPSNIESVMSSHGSALRSCYTSHVPNNPNLGGEVTLSFTINASGNVTAASTTDNTLHHAGVEGCLTSTVKPLKFAAPNKGGSCTVKWPFKFAVR